MSRLQRGSSSPAAVLQEVLDSTIPMAADCYMSHPQAVLGVALVGAAAVAAVGMSE
jgi:hypothetical protein